MFEYYKMAKQIVLKQKEEDMKKARLLKKDMDYAFLEELVQKVNENPLLRVRVTLKDGTVLDINTKPKNNPIQYLEPQEDFLEVK
jgi:hypothetical protein